MKTDISQLIDLKKIDTLLEGFNKSTGFVTAILDLDGKILSKSGWRPMCTEFHRINPETSKRCTISDTVLANKLEKGEKYHAYKCLNGLMDVAVPLKINGEHVANLFSGQFFFEQPDLAFFKKQAAAFGFDEKRYLDLLNKVPVVSEEKVKTAMDFLLNMTEFISELALQKVKQEKITQNLKDSEQKFKAIFEAANAGKSIILPSGEINVNEAYCKILGYNRQELENKKWHDLTPEEDIPTIQKLLDSLAVGDKDSVRFEKRYICKNGSHIWADESVSLQRNENGEPLHFIATVIDITERKQTERLIQEKNEEIAAQNEEMIAQNEELNQANKELIEAKNKVEVSEEKLKSIFRVAPAGIGVLYNRTFGDVNPRVCEMTGYHMEELLGKSARILYPTQEEYDFVGREKYTQITKHGTGSVETRWQRKDGQIINILLNSTPVDSDDLSKGVIFTALDITERKQSELILQEKSEEIAAQNEELNQANVDLIEAKEKAEESEEKYRAMYINAPLSYQSLDENGCFTDINPMWSKTLGYERNEVIGRWFGDFLHPDYVEHFRINFPAFKKRGYVSDVQFELRKKDNTYIYVSFEGCVGYTPEGKFKQTYCVFKDITEQKVLENAIIKAKEKAEESEQRFKSLIENAPDGVVIMDNSGKFKYVSPNAERLFGYNEDEGIGQSGDEATHPDDLPLIFKTMETILADPRQKPTVEYRFKRKNGEYRWIETTFTNLFSDKTINGIILNFTDVTERKQIFEELIIAKEKAERNEIELIKAQEIAHVGSWYLNVETNEVVWTEELYKMYGFDPALPPPPYTEHMKLFTPESWEILSSSLAKTRETGIPYELELKTIRKDNSNGWMWVRGEAVLDEGNKIIGLWGAAQDITERKQSEQELIKAKEKAEESQLHFETLFAKSPVSIMIHDIDTGEIINANNTAFTSYGFDSLEALQQNDFWMEPPYSLEDAKEQIQKAAREDIQAFEWKSRKMTGEVFWELVTLRPLVIDGAERILSTAVDITDQKRKELKEEVLFQIANASFVSEDLEALVTSIKIVLNKLIDTTNFYIAFYDKENDMFSIPYEADEKDKIETWRANKSVTGLVIKKGMPLLLKKPAILNLIKSGEIDQVGTLSEVWLGVPLFSGSDIIGVLAVQDYHNPDAYNDGSKEILKFVSSQISMGIQRKKFVQDLLSAKDKAEESERKFRLIGENTSDGIIVFDSNFQIIYVSPAYENQLGYSAKEEIFRTTEDIVDLIYPDDRDTVSEIFKAIEEKKQGLIYSYRVKHKQGHYIWREDNAKFNYDANNNYTGAYVVCRDITEKKIQEQQITAAKDKAEESDRLKSAFLANMSHEIRTPMNGILGFAELLKEPDLTGDEQQKFIGIIEKSGARMLNIINQIVDISKIEAGLMELDVKETNINMQIEYIYTFFKPEAETKGIKLSFSSTLSQKEATINTDREKVYAILTNLVKNAIKYTHEGSIEFGYKIAGTQSIASLQFFVKDTGIGIPKDRQEAIFERFVQADIEDRMAYQGAGLGLSISKAYVELLGGKIWVESEAGKGSTFYFTLPYNTKPVAETIARQHILSEKNDDVRKLKILIAEDDVVSEMLISRHIEMFGKEILKARTGFEAVEACRANPDIDLILMDIRMPNIGGYEATRQIREFNKKVVIIAQTAYGLTGDREKAINAGCDDYITKPLKKSELLALIQKYFG